MNHFTRIALAAGLLSAAALPAFAQNGTPLTGVTSPTPSDHAPAAVSQAHKMAKATTPTAKKSTAASPGAPTTPPHS
jgi:hypothetical protein